jgi:formylglycine-generating enzyme required for sulfatase activity
MGTQHLKINLRNGLSMEMVPVEGGVFLMGGGEYDRERPIHQVKVGSCYIGKYPVTQRLWQAVMGDNPSFFKGENRPVEMVSWNDAQNFFKVLNKIGSVQDFLQNMAGPGAGFRLPTEAEWEYAARGGTKSQGFQYAGSDKLAEVGWFFENSYGETKPVGLKQANELGLFDMSGNVWEWCWDWYDDQYYRKCAGEGLVLDPRGPAEGSTRVLRGGSFFYYPGLCRCTDRFSDHPDYRISSIGFRLAVPCQSVG